MNRERLDTYCERGILALVLALLVFGPLATGAVRVPDFLVLQALTIAAAGLWALRLWLNPRPQLLWPPICWPVLAFAAYAVTRYFTSDIEYLARQEMIRVLIYTLVFFIVLNNLHRQGSVQLITFTLIFLAMLISFYALWQFLTGSDHVWNFISPYKHRAGGTYICPNHFAGFLDMVLPLALAFAVAGRLKIPLKILLGYAALMMVGGLAVTLSRGGWLASTAALAGLVGVLFWRRSFRWPALAAGLLVVATALVLLSQSTTMHLRLQQIFPKNKETQSIENIRFELWQPAVDMWRDHLWWGVGPGQFDARFPLYRPLIIQMRPEHVHNDYLETLADWGVVGAALVFAAWLLLYLGVGRTWRFVRGAGRDLGGNQSNKFAFVCGASLGLGALLIHSIFDFNLHIPANALLAVSLLALLSSHLRFASEGYWLKVPLWLKTTTTLALLAAMIYLSAQGWRHAREYACMRRAQLASDFSNQQIDWYKKAYAAEPNNPDTTYAIGEALRVQSFEGNWNYAELAQQAVGWYERGMKLNPFAGDNWMRRGMCRDWLDQHDLAASDFQRADELNPNSHFTAAHVGWHYVQLGDYAAARTWFLRSLALDYYNNPIATKYLPIVDRKLLEGAAQP